MARTRSQQAHSGDAGRTQAPSRQRPSRRSRRLRADTGSDPGNLTARWRRAAGDGEATESAANSGGEAGRDAGAVSEFAARLEKKSTAWRKHGLSPRQTHEGRAGMARPRSQHAGRDAGAVSSAPLEKKPTASRRCFCRAERPRRKPLDAPWASLQDASDVRQPLWRLIPTTPCPSCKSPCCAERRTCKTASVMHNVCCFLNMSLAF